MDNLMTAPDLAEKFGVSEAALAQWRYRGTGPKFLKLGRRVMYRAVDVEAWLADRTRTMTGTAA